VRDRNGDPVEPTDVLTDDEIAADVARGAAWVRDRRLGAKSAAAYGIGPLRPCPCNACQTKETP